jgi:hypothetical protein
MNLPAFRLRRCAGSALATACLTLLLFTPAHAARTGHRIVRHRPAAVRVTKPVAPPAAVSATPVGTAGMIVAIDPESGVLVPPTAEQVRTLTAAERTGLMRTSEGLTQVRLPNGAVMVDLQGRFMEYGVVQLDPAGRPRFFGVNDESVLLALLTRYASASTPACEEK